MLVSGAANFGQTAILTRALGSESYASFGLALVASGALNALFLEWLRQAALRYLSSDGGTAFVLRLGALLREYAVVASVCLLGSFAAAVLLPGQPLALAGLLFVAEGVFNLLLSLVRARELQGQFFFLVVGRAVLSVTVAAGLMQLNPTAAAAISSVLLSFVGAMALGIILLCRAPTVRRLLRVAIRAAARRKAFRGAHIQLGKGLLLAGFVSYLSGFGDRVLFAALADADLAGQYFASMDIVGKAITLASQCLNLMLFVPLARAADQGAAELARSVRRYCGSFLAFYALALVLFVLLHPLIGSFVLGQEYRGFFVEHYISMFVIAISRSLVQNTICGALQLGKQGRAVFLVNLAYLVVAAMICAAAILWAKLDAVQALTSAAIMAALVSAGLAFLLTPTFRQRSITF